MFACVGDFGFARRQARGRMTLAGTEEVHPALFFSVTHEQLTSKCVVYGP